MNSTSTKEVKITPHAMMRLEERVKSHEGYRSWRDMVRAVRRYGKTASSLSNDEYVWYTNHIHRLGKSKRVRFSNGFAYIFFGNHGKAKTLLTVIPMDNSRSIVQ